MSIQKLFVVCCDNCGAKSGTDMFIEGSEKPMVEEAKDHGWIIDGGEGGDRCHVCAKDES